MTITVGLHSRVLTHAGPVAASDLKVGDSVVTLHGDGQLQLTTVAACQQVTDVPGKHVLTEVGDVWLAPHEALLTTTGPLAAGDLPDVLAKSTAKVEVVQPDELMRHIAKPTGTARERALAAVAALGRPFTAIPASVLPVTVAAARQVLKTAGLSFTEHVDDRWVAWNWKPIEPAGDALPDPDALLALTAWGGTESRTTVDAYATRASILQSLVLERRQPKVSWTPGYFPVECRIGLSPGATAYAKVVAVRQAAFDAVSISLARRGAIITCQMAVGRLG